VTIFSVVSLGGFDKRFCGEASKERLVSCYMTLIYANSWEDFSRKAFLHLGRVLTVEEIEALKKRAVNLAMEWSKTPMSRCSSINGGAYDELPAVVLQFQEKPLFDRKIQEAARCTHSCGKTGRRHAA
jgi:hypothetical protein